MVMFGMADSSNGQKDLFEMGLPIGVCLGVCFGLIFHNLALGIALGAALGLIYDRLRAEKNKKGS